MQTNTDILNKRVKTKQNGEQIKKDIDNICLQLISNVIKNYVNDSKHKNNNNKS